MRRLILLGAAAGLLVSACGSQVDAQAVVASSQGSVGVGTQRVLVAVVDAETGQSLASEDVDVTASLRDRIGSPLGEYPGDFVWMIPDVRGLYRFEMEIPGPGTFQLVLESEDFGELGPVGLVTVEDPQMVSIGESAPLSATRTTATNELDEITTDPSPEPSFYEMTVAEAIEDGPSVIVFATPAWCTTQACGPMLDQVKALSSDYPELNYVHVEIYENINASSFDELVLVPAVVEWGLPSEPWVFVVDGSGVVTHSFEGVAADAELADAFSAVSP